MNKDYSSNRERSPLPRKKITQSYEKIIRYFWLFPWQNRYTYEQYLPFNYKSCPIRQINNQQSIYRPHGKISSHIFKRKYIHFRALWLWHKCNSHQTTKNTAIKRNNKCIYKILSMIIKNNYSSTFLHS